MKTFSMQNVVPDDMDYTDPSKKFRQVRAYTAAPGQRPDPYARKAPKNIELCWACGWTWKNQTLSSYGPRVRVMHTKNNNGIWTIGSRWVLHDQPNDRYLGNHYMTVKFLLRQPGLTIPLPKEIHSLSQPTDPILFTLESRVPGLPLNQVWLGLSPDEKASYSRQMADILKQMRQMTSPRMQKVDGSRLDDRIVSVCSGKQVGSCFKIGYDVDQWFEDLGPDLRIGLACSLETTDPIVIEEKFRELRDNFPPCEPYVLAHGDLNLTNIIVKDGKIQGIIDWEMAGYYPWWMDRWVQGNLPGGPGSELDTDELFDPIWKELEPDLSREKFVELVHRPIEEATQAFSSCTKDHPYRNVPEGLIEDCPMWLKDSFCECQPIQGHFKPQFWGVEQSCEIDARWNPEVDTRMLEERYKRKDPRALASTLGKDLETPPSGSGQDESK
ncbi:hypothetical protein A1O3_06143 [Capronia epimyces CBS 606.96]|uniref:Aminoglycoside phosphotransferase domain-containing protein n=1 Tax=Capronia epimyces CBS 606.96 TaxID=1182542 RepID=W9XY89_9EURO|nr:uncharacterized protein A1O3_06143 [Capronia epimyces CBS 606.96]EXJ82330.1 hypothetical protein A1O3_06143 [Capronia epimyces CBS 606.96]